MIHLYDLPDENISWIFGYLTTKNILLQCALVSKRWANIASESDLYISIRHNNEKALNFLNKYYRKKQMLQLKSLCLSGNILKAKHVEMIIFSDKLINITDLDLSYNNIGADYLCKRLTRSLKNLTCLNMKFSGFGWLLIKFDVFSGSSTLRNLKSLDLSYEKVEEKGIEYISKNLKLHTLKLRGCFIGDSLVKHINNMDQLTSLDLSLNSIGQDGFIEFSNGPVMKNLKLLDISDQNLGHAFNLLFSSENVKQLESLSLREIYPFGNFENMKNLKELNLSQSRCRSCLIQLAMDNLISQLVILNIDCNFIGNESLEKIRNAKNLRELNLSRNNITCRGAQTLSNFELPSLQSLILDGNPIKYLGICSLLNSKTLPNPKKLLTKNKLKFNEND